MFSAAKEISSVLPQAKPKSIRYVSLDLDGCILNKEFKKSAIAYDMEKEGEGDSLYLKSRSEALLKVNEGLLNRIISDMSKDHSVSLKLMVGSNRQDCNIDGANAVTQRVGSLVPAMLSIESFLRNKLKDVPCELDKYLLADTFGGKEPGTAFDLIHGDRNGDKHKHDTAIVDEYKWLLVFAQTHKAASENLFAHVTFDFYDDHVGHLSKLQEFYAANPDLLPENLTLRLHHYDGKNYDFKGEIHGKTKSLDKYGEGVMAMLASAGCTELDIRERRFDSWSFYEAYSNPDVLAKFKNEMQKLQGILPLEVVRKVEEAGQPVAPNDNNADVRQADEINPDELSPEVRVLNDHITELKRNFAHQPTINDLVGALEVARDAFSEDFKRMRLSKFTQKKIQNSAASQSLKLTENFLVKLQNADPVVQQQGVNEFITDLQTQTRKNKFAKILWGIAVVAVCFVVGAGVGFAAGLGIGAATGPGAIFTAIGGALVGAVLAAVIGAGVGAGVGAALGGTFFGRFIYKKSKNEEPANNAMQEVARRVTALKAG